MLYYDLIIIYLVIAYAHGIHYKHLTRIIINKFYFNINETCKCNLAHRLGNIHHFVLKKSWI